MIPVLERAKTFHAFDGSANVPNQHHEYFITRNGMYTTWNISSRVTECTPPGTFRRV
jgi:hypothetical protein